ncbi:phosphomannomutase, partial [Mesorhizobium sp. CU2]
TDGLRARMVSGEIVHLRPSGNAPEFRCYAEAASHDRASEIVAIALERARDAGLSDERKIVE